MPDDTNGKRIAIDDAGDAWDEIESGLFKARCGRGHQCDVPGECHGDELLLAELAYGYGLRSLTSAPSPAVDRETLGEAIQDATVTHHVGGSRRLGDADDIADALLARYDIRERGETQVEPDGVALIASKRHAVIAKGRTPEHDDQHVHGELLDAARCYANQGRTWFPEFTHRYGTDAASMSDQGWPWWIGEAPEGWHPSGDPIENLANAGQLIAAEIDRLQRERGDQS